MKTIVLYYTLGGATKDIAEQIAIEYAADIEQVFELKNRNILSAFIPGCPSALHRSASKILPITSNLAAYDRIVIGCPIWAGFPAPAFNAIISQLPREKDVELFFCSSGGEEPKSIAGNKALICEKSCRLLRYRDYRTSQPITMIER